MAGCYPVWWVVPPEQEANYDDFTYRLMQQGFVSADSTIDFGGLGEIPAGEFVGGGMWQLYKAIASPYKSILKLFLTEAYASTYPDVKALFLDLKSHIFNDDLALDKLDPYLLLYNRLADYLTQMSNQSA